MMNTYLLIFIFVTNNDNTEKGQCSFIIQMLCAQVTSLYRGNIARVSIKWTGQRHCWNYM